MNQQYTASTLEDIRPPHPLIQLGLSPRDMLWMGLGIGIVILLLVIWFFFFKKKKQEKSPSFYEITLQRLKTIANEGHQLSDEQWGVLVSECVRVYFEKTLNLPAPERTTEEFLSSLGEHELFQSQEMFNVLENFLKKCDLIKFAKQKLSSEERMKLMQYAEHLIHLAHTWLIQKSQEAQQ